MKALWTEQPGSTFDGRFWQLEGASMEPKPFQKPGPPMWFGGSHPNAIRRAVRYGDGFFGAGSSTTAAFAEQVKVLREVLAGPAARTSRSPSASTSPSTTTGTPLAAAPRRVFPGIYGTHRFEGVSVAGTPEESSPGSRRWPRRVRS